MEWKSHYTPLYFIYNDKNVRHFYFIFVDFHHNIMLCTFEVDFKTFAQLYESAQESQKHPEETNKLTYFGKEISRNNIMDLFFCYFGFSVMLSIGL
jgi:hypothetical protein